MALRIAVDTNRYTDFMLGEQSVRETFRRADQIHLPFVVLAELRAGFRSGRRRDHNERILHRFLQTPRVSVVFADGATTQIYADIFVGLRKAGTPIPTNDIWIAAIVLQHDLTLFTRDRHFEHVSRIQRI